MCDRSASATIRPQWCRLYAAGLAEVAGLALAEIAMSPGGLRTGVRCAIALAAFLTMAVWVYDNRAALDLHDWCDCAPTTITVRVVESRRRPTRVEPDPPNPAPAWIEHEPAGR